MKLPAILRRAAVAQRPTNAPAAPPILTKPNQSLESAYEAAMSAAEARYEAEVAEIERRFSS